MTLTFPLPDGDIARSVEVKGAYNTPGTAYFSGLDYTTPIDREGYFAGLYGAEYRVLWPLPGQPEATLQECCWHTVSRVTPAL